MNDPPDYRTPIEIGGPDVVVYVCGMGRMTLWQAGMCEGSVKHPDNQRCWYCDSEGVCRRIEMENEQWQKNQ
jgi:hypothetical protein